MFAPAQIILSLGAFPEFSTGISVPVGKGFTVIVTELNEAEHDDVLDTSTVTISPFVKPVKLAVFDAPFWNELPFLLKL